jgi:hypothetical protein
MPVLSFVILAGMHLFGAASPIVQQTAKTVRTDTLSGPLEITARNQSDKVRLISVQLNKRPLTEFRTEAGDRLDLLATYAGSDVTYVVLRTNMGQGACVGTDVFVLTILEAEKSSRANVSPILQKCMGEEPTIKFDNGVVSVAGFSLRNNKWVAEGVRK